MLHHAGFLLFKISSYDIAQDGLDFSRYVQAGFELQLPGSWDYWLVPPGPDQAGTHYCLGKAFGTLSGGVVRNRKAGRVDCVQI